MGNLNGSQNGPPCDQPQGVSCPGKGADLGESDSFYPFIFPKLLPLRLRTRSHGRILIVIKLIILKHLSSDVVAAWVSVMAIIPTWYQALFLI